MRRLILFFAGLILLALMFAMLLFTGAIYDTVPQTRLHPHFFQPDDNANRRPGRPDSVSDIGDASMREMLISKYITEMFYVTPDTAETQRRISGETSLVHMSTRQSFQTWLDEIAPAVEELSARGVLRTVSVIDAEFQSKTDQGEYWKITYQLKTWERPNDFSVLPVHQTGIVYLDIYYMPGLRSDTDYVSSYLESGGDPSAVFRFGVFDIVLQE
ncbi:MAG: hypothetical protein E7011_02540 [Alphaproteobacteria bacterium]|nr:hypothetical protein [Alphaproteobacteria bacterium]